MEGQFRERAGWPVCPSFSSEILVSQETAQSHTDWGGGSDRGQGRAWAPAKAEPAWAFREPQGLRGGESVLLSLPPPPAPTPPGGHHSREL